MYKKLIYVKFILSVVVIYALFTILVCLDYLLLLMCRAMDAKVQLKVLY